MHTLHMIDPHRDIKLTLILDKSISWLAVILTVLPSISLSLSLSPLACTPFPLCLSFLSLPRFPHPLSLSLSLFTHLVLMKHTHTHTHTHTHMSSARVLSETTIIKVRKTLQYYYDIVLHSCYKLAY